MSSPSACYDAQLQESIEGQIITKSSSPISHSGIRLTVNRSDNLHVHDQYKTAMSFRCQILFRVVDVILQCWFLLKIRSLENQLV